MTSVVVRPNKNWQLYFRQVYHTDRSGNKVLSCLIPEGESRGKTPPKGVTLQENFEFSTRIRFTFAEAGCSSAHVVFLDTDPKQPIQYTMSGEELRLLFHGIQTGQIPVHPDGYDVRMTFVKRCTQVFAKPIV